MDDRALSSYPTWVVVGTGTCESYPVDTKKNLELVYFGSLVVGFLWLIATYRPRRYLPVDHSRNDEIIVSSIPAMATSGIATLPSKFTESTTLICSSPIIFPDGKSTEALFCVDRIFRRHHLLISSWTSKFVVSVSKKKIATANRKIVVCYPD